MDARDYFKLHRSSLLELIRTEYGRSLIGIKDNLRIFKISPNSYHQLIGAEGDKIYAKATFFTSDRIIEKLAPVLWQMNARQFSPSFFPGVHLLSTVFNPSTGEGVMARQDETTWADARDAATADSVNAQPGIESTYTGDPSRYYLCYRAAQPFNTVSLGPGAAVSAVLFEAYRDDSKDIGGNPFANQNTTTTELVVSTQSDPGGTLVTADFNNLSFVSKGSQALASTSDAAYSISITISDTTVVQTSGYTTLYAITGLDLSNTAPGTGATAKNNRMFWQDRGEANPAKLTVTYTAGGGLDLTSKLW